MQRLLLGILLASFIVMPKLLIAGGYGIPMQGQRYVGMGNIGTGFSLDAATIFYNPGGLAMLEEKTSVSLGVSTSFLYNDFSSDTFSSASTDNPISTPFHLYASYKINDKLAAGLGVYTPYGNEIEWEQDWPGQYLVTQLDLVGIYFQPTISYQPFEKLSIGGGPVIAYGHVELKRNQFLDIIGPLEGPLNINETPENASVIIEGSTFGFGFHVGAMYKVSDKLQVGLRHLGKVDMSIDDGDAEFNNFEDAQNLLPDSSSLNSFQGELPLPSKTTLGVSYEFSQKFRMGMDLTFVRWGVYDSLIVEFQEKSEQDFPPDSREPREYDDTFIFKIGGEYDVSDLVTVRAGFSYDQVPIPQHLYTPEVPDNDKLGFSAGVSVTPLEWLTVDASFVYLYGIEQDFSFEPSQEVSALLENHPYDNNPFRGKMKTDVFLPGLGLTMNF